MTSTPLLRQLLQQRSWLRQLRSLLRSQGLVALRQTIHGLPVDLSAWNTALADTAAAHLGPVAAQSFRTFLRNYLRRGGRIRQALFPEPDPFAIEMPEVRRFIQQQAYTFARSVNQTSGRYATDAAQLFRDELSEGLERGEAQARLTQRLDRIFQNPTRTAMITHNETSRSLHGGQFEAVHRFTDPMKKRLIASGDACPICLDIAAKGWFDLDEPMYNDGRGTVYSTPLFAPIHVNCFCSTAYEPV